MMELPLGFRVSGSFGTKDPIKTVIGSPITVTISGASQSVSYYEGGLLRSPPEWRAYTHVCTHVAKDCARRRP